MVAPISAGLAIGAAFVLIFSTFFGQTNGVTPILGGEYHPRPGRISDQAVRIAMADVSLQKMFEGREIVVTGVRDWGVTAGSECPIGWCAIILFDDTSDNITTGLAAATVSVRASKVMDRTLHKDILTMRANETEEVKHFVSKYPDAQVEVKREGTKAIFVYGIARQSHTS